MSEPAYCFISTTYCNEECSLFHEATGICKITMMINRFLGPIDGPEKKTPPPTPEAQIPVVESMKIDNPFPELVPGNFLPSIAGRIATPIQISEVTAQGKPTPIAKFSITDGIRVIPTAIWEPGNTLNGFNVGSWITLTKMSIREYQGETQISSTRNTKISR